MNKTKIDWADMTWNPVTGCLNGCPYCYARKIANRFGGKETEEMYALDRPDMVPHTGKIIPYPYGFTPTFHRYRLDEPQHIKKPQRIFVCSMADLFGDWVPDEWIQQVFDACKAAPWHKYMFLTKNPKRYEKVLDKPFTKNMWFGWSQDGPVGDALRHTTDGSIQSFVSIEPLLRPFETTNVCGVDWVIIGAETGNRKGKVVPKREWIETIVEASRNAGVPVFMKESLRELMGPDFVQEWPKGLAQP